MKKIRDNAALLTANFNFGWYTYYMLKSFVKQAGIGIPMYILENSTAPSPFVGLDGGPVHVIDNTMFKHTPDYNQPSMNHCSSLEYAMSIIPERYVILCDNDVLFHKSINKLLDMPADSFDACGEIGWDILPPDRLFPYLCIIDNYKKKRQRISYFDAGRIVHYGMDSNHMDKKYSVYDTGYSFLDDIMTHNWKIKEIKFSDYIVHLKGASLHKKDFRNWIAKYHNMY